MAKLSIVECLHVKTNKIYFEVVENKWNYPRLAVFRELIEAEDFVENKTKQNKTKQNGE